MRRSQEVPRGVREEKLEGCSPLLTSPSPYFSYWWREMKDWYPWAKGSAGWNLSVAPLSVARNAGPGSCSNSCFGRRAWATRSSALQGGRPTHTRVPQAHPRTHSHMLSLTLNWIFKLIALWFSYKTNSGPGASGQNFQVLCCHLEYDKFLLI